MHATVHRCALRRHLYGRERSLEHSEDQGSQAYCDCLAVVPSHASHGLSYADKVSHVPTSMRLKSNLRVPLADFGQSLVFIKMLLLLPFTLVLNVVLLYVHDFCVFLLNLQFDA